MLCSVSETYSGSKSKVRGGTAVLIGFIREDVALKSCSRNSWGEVDANLAARRVSEEISSI